MTEYEKIRNHATERGWTYEYASGDHIKFYPPPGLGKSGFVTVSISVNSNNRSFKNSVGEFRKFDRDFMRTSKRNKMTETSVVTVPDTESDFSNTTTDNYEQTYMKPNDRTIYKQYSWLQIGTKVRVKNDENQSTPLIVKEIHSVDHKRVWDESDIVIVKGGGDNEHMAGDLDAWEVRKCRVCGQYQPINHFNLSAKSETKKTICRDCQKEESIKNSEPAEKMNPVSDSTINKDTPFDICKDIFLNQLNSADRIMILSKIDAKDLLTIMNARRLLTDISLFGDDEIARETARRKILDRVFNEYPEGYKTTEKEQLKLIEYLFKIRWNSNTPTISNKLDELYADIALNLPIKDFEYICKEYNKTHTGYNLSTSMENFTDKELYQELKHRGWEGKLTRSQTLE